MSMTVLACTLGIELGLAVGYCFAHVEMFVHEGRMAVLAMLHWLDRR